MAAIPAGWPPGHPNHQVRGLSGWLEKRPSSEKDGKSTPMQWKLRWVVLSPVSFTSEGEFATITWFEKDTLKGGPKGSMKLQLGSVVEPGEDEGEFVVHSADGTQSLRMRAVRKGFDEGSENAPKPAAEWISATMAVLETLKPLADKRKRQSLTDAGGEPKLEVGPKVGELGC